MLRRSRLKVYGPLLARSIGHGIPSGTRLAAVPRGRTLEDKGRQRPLPATFAPVNRAGTGPLSGRGRLVLTAIDRTVAEIETHDAVVAGDGLVGGSVEHTGRDPFVTAAPKVVPESRPPTRCSAVDPRTPRPQAHQDPLEAHPIRDPRAMTAQRTCIRHSPQEWIDRGPDSIDQFGVEREHDVGHLHRVVG